MIILLRKITNNMFRFNFLETPLKGLISVQRNVIEDDRGFLSRFYCKEEFSAAGFDIAIVQMNPTPRLTDIFAMA